MMKKFAIFGKPLKHSISPKMHNYALNKLKIAGEYIPYELENGEDIKKIFLEKKFQGANVTVPYKELAFKQCDKVEGIAQKIKAVNTLVKKDDKMFGYNTDAMGFMMSIESFFPLKSALILGAGGTAKAISYALREKQINVSLLNRSEKRLFDFKDFETFTWNNFSPANYSIIINTTSAGLVDENLPAPKEILLECMKKTLYVFDVIYHKKTPFLKMAEEFKKPFKDGKDMLIFQGVLAFELFMNLKANDELISIFKEGFSQ